VNRVSQRWLFTLSPRSDDCQYATGPAARSVGSCGCRRAVHQGIGDCSDLLSRRCRHDDPGQSRGTMAERRVATRRFEYIRTTTHRLADTPTLDAPDPGCERVASD